jgi:hypothetical protein
MTTDPTKIIQSVTDFSNSPVFENTVFVVRIIFIVFSFLMIGFIIWALIKTTWLKRYILWDMQEFLTYHPYGTKKLYKQWQKIKIRLESGLESEYKLAVMEADSLLDDVLRAMGIAGETLGEKLEKVTDATLPNMNKLLETRKIRNSIVHDPGYKLTLDESRSAVEVYEKSLADLQAL